MKCRCAVRYVSVLYVIGGWLSVAGNLLLVSHPDRQTVPPQKRQQGKQTPPSAERKGERVKERERDTQQQQLL